MSESSRVRALIEKHLKNKDNIIFIMEFFSKELSAITNTYYEALNQISIHRKNKTMIPKDIESKKGELSEPGLLGRMYGRGLELVGGLISGQQSIHRENMTMSPKDVESKKGELSKQAEAEITKLEKIINELAPIIKSELGNYFVNSNEDKRREIFYDAIKVYNPKPGFFVRMIEWVLSSGGVLRGWQPEPKFILLDFETKLKEDMDVAVQANLNNAIGKFKLLVQAHDLKLDSVAEIIQKEINDLEYASEFIKIHFVAEGLGSLQQKILKDKIKEHTKLSDSTTQIPELANKAIPIIANKIDNACMALLVHKEIQDKFFQDFDNVTLGEIKPGRLKEYLQAIVKIKGEINTLSRASADDNAPDQTEALKKKSEELNNNINNYYKLYNDVIFEYDPNSIEYVAANLKEKFEHNSTVQSIKRGVLGALLCGGFGYYLSSQTGLNLLPGVGNLATLILAIGGAAIATKYAKTADKILKVIGFVFKPFVDAAYEIIDIGRKPKAYLEKIFRYAAAGGTAALIVYGLVTVCLAVGLSNPFTGGPIAAVISFALLAVGVKYAARSAKVVADKFNDLVYGTKYPEVFDVTEQLKNSFGAENALAIRKFFIQEVKRLDKELIQANDINKDKLDRIRDNLFETYNFMKTQDNPSDAIKCWKQSAKILYKTYMEIGKNKSSSEPELSTKILGLKIESSVPSLEPGSPSHQLNAGLNEAAVTAVPSAERSTKLQKRKGMRFEAGNNEKYSKIEELKAIHKLVRPKNSSS